MIKMNEKHKMGRWSAVSYIIGAIIGSGIFITPTTILNNVHSVGASLLIWLLAGIIATLGALCYVELGTSIRKSGCDFAYLCHVRWNSIAFIFMTTSCFFINPSGLAIQMETFSVYAIRCLNIEFCNESNRFIAHKLISFSLLLILFFINCFSISNVVSRVQIISVIAKFVASGIIIFCGFYFLLFNNKDIQFNNLRHPFVNSNFRPGDIALALFGGFYSYDGWDILNYGVEDIKSPRRTLPFAIIVSMSVVASIYFLMNLSFFIVLSVPEMQSSNAVAMVFAEKTLGAHFKYLIALLICIVLIGTINASLFACSRFLWASAREKHLPAFLSCINRESNSPRAALFIHVVLAMCYSFLGNLEQMISYVAFTVWIIRSFTMLSLLCIRFGICKRPIHEKSIQFPLILPIIFLCVCVTLVSITIIQSFKSSIVGLLILAIGLIIYLLFIWEKAFQRFGVYRRLSNSFNQYTCILSQFLLNGNIELISPKEVDDDFASIEEKSFDDYNIETTQTELNNNNNNNGNIRKIRKNTSKVFPTKNGI